MSRRTSPAMTAIRQCERRCRRHGLTLTPIQQCYSFSKLLFTQHSVRKGGRYGRHMLCGTYEPSLVERLYKEAVCDPRYRGISADTSLGLPAQLAAALLRILDASSASLAELLDAAVSHNAHRDPHRGHIPRALADFMARLAVPKPYHTVVDPYCVTAELLTAASAASQGYPRLAGRFTGSAALSLARLRLLLHGHDPRAVLGDTDRDSTDSLALLDGASPAEVVLTRLPHRGTHGALVAGPSPALPQGHAATTHLQRVVDTLIQDGVAVVLVPEAIPHPQGTPTLASTLCRGAQLDAVIGLPRHAIRLPGTQASPFVLVLRKVSPRLRDTPPADVFVRHVAHVGYTQRGASTENNDLPATLVAYQQRAPHHCIPANEAWKLLSVTPRPARGRSRPSSPPQPRLLSRRCAINAAKPDFFGFHRKSSVMDYDFGIKEKYS